jgi:hypothetical protein
MRRFAGLWWCMGFILTADLLLRCSGWWYLVPQSSPGQYAFVQQQIGTQVAPAVVVFGSSRTRDGIAPRVMELVLQLPPGTVLNLSFSSGLPSEALTMYRAHRRILSQARWLVFGVEDWQFDARSRTERFRALSGLKTRLSLPSIAAKAEHALGWLWAFWDMREVLRNYHALITAGNFPGPPNALDTLGRIVTKENQLETGTADDQRLQAYVDRNFNGWQAWPYQAKALAELVTVAQADGLRVSVIRLPTRQAYQDKVRERYAQLDDEWRLLLTKQLPDTPVYHITNAEVGLSDEDYVDYGHMAVRGAIKLSTWLARHESELSAGK